ncbi:GNAT family N-acetyltransferase [Candidatus Saccharibacteria bacterium]|nr:GNAT family N-acetyltransferase [Candidatus Saccharibacteria bacterium]
MEPEKPSQSQEQGEKNNGEEWQEMTEEVRNDGERREEMGEVEVRLLNPETDDLEKAADLIWQVDPYICPDFFGDEKRAREFGKVLFKDDGGMFDSKHVLVAEDKDEPGKLLGILVFLDNKVEPWNTEAVKQEVEGLGVEMPENFDRCNEEYMKMIVDEARKLPDGVAEVEWCATDKAARGKGVASKMFDKFLSMPEYHEQHLVVLADNPSAIHVYEKKGFEIVSTQTGYPDDTVKTHSMIRKA